jgi:periplasmic protein TonB
MQTNIPANLDELVFASRNRDYGSYVLRKQMATSTYRGFVIGVTFLTLCFLFPQIIALVNGALPTKVDKTDIEGEINTLPTPKEEPLPPPPAATPPPPRRAQVRYVPPVVVPDDAAQTDQPPVNIDSLNGRAIGTQTTEGEGEEVVPTNFPTQPDETIEVEKEPAFDAPFPGEEPKAVNMDEVRRLIGYPEVAIEVSIEGTVTVRLLVDKKGKYVKHLVIGRKPHPVLIKAVEERLPLLSFTPGIQAGKPVPVWVNIPFKFSLKH